MFKISMSILVILNAVTISAATKVENHPPVLPKIADDEFAIFDGTKYKNFKIFELEKVTYSIDCKSSKVTCMAVASLKKMPKEIPSSSGVSPASRLCTRLDGVSLIAFNSKKEEYNFCVFADGSMASSWSLYYKFFPKKIIK